MDIPVFVSCMTQLSPDQEDSRKIVLHYLEKYKLEPRALGRSDYPMGLPLTEVLGIARHCAGGVILGFEQYRSLAGVSRPGALQEQRRRAKRSFPTPWNHLEAGILYALKLPMLIFREPAITDGIFDAGVVEVFTHPMPTDIKDEGLDDVFLKWQASVRRTYYDT